MEAGGKMSENSSFAANGFPARLNESGIPVWIEYEESLKIWLAFVLILILIGTFFNVPLLIAIATSKKLNTGSGTLIAHLLFLESMLCAVWNPIICISMYTAHIQPLSDIFCEYALLGYYVFIHCANWSTLLLAINRFVAVMFPHHYGRFSSKPALFLSVCFGWIVALSFNMPGFLGISGYFRPSPPWGGCGTKVMVPWFNTLSVTILTSVPVSGVGAAYLIMLLKIGRRWLKIRHTVLVPKINDETARRENATKGPGRSLLQKRYASVRMLFVSYLWYSLCYLPAPIASSMYTKAYASLPALQLAFRGIALMGYALNPVIYISMNPDYRKRFFKLLHIDKDERNLKGATPATMAQSQADSALVNQD